MNSKRTIAVIAGGYSSEIVISLKSAEGIRSFLDPERYTVYTVLITRERWTVCLEEGDVLVDKNDFSFNNRGEKVRFDFAYITIHGTPGEDGLLQGYFDMLGIPYSCCGVLAASLTFNKYFCNRFLGAFGVKTARSLYLRKGETVCPEKIGQELGYPVFVKPNDGGSSFGTTKVNAAADLEAAVALAFGEGKEVMIEGFMAGTEITCGCYRVNGRMQVLPITEVVSKNEFFDFDAKYNPASVEEITPARIPDRLAAEVQELTCNIYQWIGAKGIIRVDYIISPEGEVRMLEVNTTPGMTATSFIPQQIKAAGLNIRDVITEIIEDELNKI